MDANATEQGPSPERVACLVVPSFPLAARLRSEPGLRREPLVLVDDHGGAPRVVFAGRRAREAGVRPKQTLATARARFPRLVVRRLDSECEDAAQQALLDVAESFSPRVEDGGEGVVFLDASGLDHELELGHAWVAAVGKQAGLQVRVGFGTDRLDARAAAVPDSSVAGAETLEENSQPVVSRRPPPVFREGMTLAEPLVDLETFSFLVRGALERICERLKAQTMSCTCLELILELEPERSYRRSVALPTAMSSVKSLLTLLRLEIESHPPRAAIRGFAVIAHPDRPRGGQISLFGPPAVLPEKLAAALERLFATVGEDRVGSPCTADGCRPERYRLAPFAPPGHAEPRSVEPPSAESGAGLMAVRVLRPPVALEVMTGEPHDDEASAPPPDFIKSPPQAPVERPRIQGQVRVASGPWTLADGWWTKTPTARDYWDVELSCSGVYRIFRDRGSGDWFADGVYD